MVVKTDYIIFFVWPPLSETGMELSGNNLFNPRSGIRYPNIHCVTGKGFCLKKNKKIYFGTMASTSITAGEAQPQYT